MRKDPKIAVDVENQLKKWSKGRKRVLMQGFKVGMKKGATKSWLMIDY